MKFKKSIAPPFAVATLALSLLTVTSFGTYAALVAEAENVTPQTITSGTLSLSLGENGASFSDDVANLVPGDIVNRHVLLTNDGTVEGQNLTLQIAATGSPTLITDGASTSAVTLAINSCSVAWTPSTGACGGDEAIVQAATSMADFGTPISLISEFDVSAAQHLQLSFSLPDQDETTLNGVPPAESIQGKTMDVTFSFQIEQLVGTETSQ